MVANQFYKNDRFRYSFSKSLKLASRFKNDRFFPKTKRSFLKTIKNKIKNDRFQKRLTTLTVRVPL